MDSEPLPDHFKALGVDRNADASAIKKAHRLLVLQCHPDKVTVTDPVVKQQKADQFHQIQKAYETLIDEKERATYEANLTLEALRKEKLARGGASTSREKSTRFDARPSGGASSRYATEERKPSTSYDDDKYYDERARDRARTSTRSKYDTYSSYPKSASSPRTEKESSRSAKSTTERQRSERTKARDKDDRRSRPFVSVDSDTSSADEKARYERDYKRRSHEEEVRKQDADARRKTDDRRSYEDPQYDASPSARKLSTLEGEALRYQHKSRADVESQHRPSIARNSSRDYYESSRSSRKESRPEPVRRSSARPKERATSSSTRDREGRDRDRGFPEIVDWGEGESSSRRMPPLKHNNSSPAGIEIPRNLPQRSYTAAEPSSRDRRTSTSPPPMLSRSQTMPSAHVSSRSKPAAASRGTPLYQSVVPEHSVPEHYASIPPPQPSSASKSTKYYYPTPAGGVPLRQEDILAGARTVLREPGSSQRHRSPESKAPLGRPPIGANRPSEANIHKTAMPPPPLGRSSSSPTREERGRSGRPLYGEVRTASYAQRPQPVRQGSYTPSGDVKYSQKIGPDDVRWSSRGRENNPDYPPSKPTLGRTATYVY